MFMQPEFNAETGYAVETCDGRWFVPSSVCGTADSPEDLIDHIQGDVGEETELEQVSGVFWRLSAPEYLDCTEWTFAEFLTDAIRDCLGMYGDDPEIASALADELPEFAEFWEGYLLGLAFTCTDDSGDPPEMWSNPGGDIADVVDTEDVVKALGESVDDVRADCLSFLLDALPLLGDITPDIAHAGSDFHLTRNGHGAGFWDGDWDNGDKLTELAKPYGTAELSWWVDETGELQFDLHN